MVIRLMYFIAGVIIAMLVALVNDHALPLWIASTTVLALFIVTFSAELGEVE